MAFLAIGALFFANFVLSWLATVLAIDRSLGNLFAKNEQIEAERVGKQAMQ